jgi:hypothetical protein
MKIDTVVLYIAGVATFIAVMASMFRGFFKHRGLKGLLFGAGIRLTVGEVEGKGRTFMSEKITLKVHVLDAAPEKALGLEFVAKSIASYQIIPFSMSATEARKLIAHLQTAIKQGG